MKNLLKGLLVLCCLFATTTVNAADKSMTVTYTGTDNYIVEIPATLALTTNADDKQSGTYTVKVTGDFTGSVTVTPATSVTMKETSGAKADVIATVSQDKKVWTLSDLTTDANGTITTASNLGAGNWTGTLEFTITKN